MWCADRNNEVIRIGVLGAHVSDFVVPLLNCPSLHCTHTWLCALCSSVNICSEYIMPSFGAMLLAALHI